jgi:glutamate N-acetyltransferase/amino-acid N-acetyltransferase
MQELGTDGLGPRASACASLWRSVWVCAGADAAVFDRRHHGALPIDRIEAGLGAAIADARRVTGLRAAEGIMTTDTAPKAFGRAGDDCWQGPVSMYRHQQGAGMIRPNMATMLGFMATDACVSHL